MQAGFTVVTEARVTEPEVPDKLNACLSIICNAITEKHMSLLETSHLFLEIDWDIGACNYYFVDHVLRTIFWLHMLNEISVGRSLAMSNGHLRMFLYIHLRGQGSRFSHPGHVLQENYWIHVGLFPETASQYSSVALNELQAVLLLDCAGEAGKILSYHPLGVTDYIHMPETPDFPYTAKQRGGLVDLLERSKGVFLLAHRPQLTKFCQIVPPAPKLLPMLLCYGRLSVCTRLGTPDNPSYLV